MAVKFEIRLNKEEGANFENVLKDKTRMNCLAKGGHWKYGGTYLEMILPAKGRVHTKLVIASNKRN